MTSSNGLIQKLVCPRTHSPLIVNEGFLTSDSGAKYFIVDDTPVMLLDDVKQTMDLVEKSLRRARGEGGDVRAPELYLESLGLVEEEKKGIVDLYSPGNFKIDPVVSFLVGATNGIMYKHLIGSLTEYPIPRKIFATVCSKSLGPSLSRSVASAVPVDFLDVSPRVRGG